MSNSLRYLFSSKKPPTDFELFSSLDASTFIFLSVVNDYVRKENQVIEVTEMTPDEIEYIYRLIADAALCNFNHIDRENLKLSLLDSIPEEYSALRADIKNADYLPPPSPTNFVGQVQELLNKTFQPGQHFSDEQFGILFAYIGSCFRQGNKANLGQLNEYENNFATLLFIGTHNGLEEASKIRGVRESSNRHFAHLFMLSAILGMKFSRDNELEASDS